MTIAPHINEVHHMVDRLAPAQVEALYVLLQGMIGRTGAAGPAEAVDNAVGVESTGVAPAHRFAFIGIMDGEPDLAERSARILREELGNPAT